MKYRYIQSLSGQYPLHLMCRILDVTPQGYHQWKHGAEKRAEKHQSELELRSHIRAVYQEARKTYGRIRVRRELRKQNIEVNEKRAGRVSHHDNGWPPNQAIRRTIPPKK